MTDGKRLSLPALPKIDFEKLKRSSGRKSADNSARDEDPALSDFEDEDSSASSSSSSSVFSPRLGSPSPPPTPSPRPLGSGGGGRGSSRGQLPTIAKKRSSPFDRLPLRIHDMTPESPHPSIKNSDSTCKEILRRLTQGPTAADGHGFVAIYRMDPDRTSDLYRRVVAIQDVPEPRLRIPDWGDLTLVSCRRSRRHKHAALLTRLYMDAMRVHRYLLLDLGAVVSVYRNSRLVVGDGSMAPNAVLPPLLGRPVQKDWFVTNEEVLVAIVISVTAATNEHWTDEPWATENLSMMK